MQIIWMMNDHQTYLQQYVGISSLISTNTSNFGVDIRKILVYSENIKKAFTKWGDLSAGKGGYYSTAGGE